MTTTYRVIAGDTFDIISRKEYGFETEGGRIAQANPGLAEPLTPGTSIIIPTFPGALTDSPQQQTSVDPDETALTIDNKRFRFWTQILITRQTDTISTIAFTAPFDPTVKEQRDLFRPMSFKDISVTIGGKPVFKGTLMTPTPVATESSFTISVTGYSLPGVLMDCPLPITSYPKEFIQDESLKQIADIMMEPFGLEAIFDADPGAVFEQVRPEPGEQVLVFLTKLAKQRKLVIGDSPTGQLVFRQSVLPGNPVAKFVQGESFLMSVKPTYNPQKYFSHITGLQASTIVFDATSFTVKNPQLSNVVRPFTFDAPDTRDVELKDTVLAKAGRMFADSVSYTVEVPFLRDAKGNLWEPNTTLIIKAPKAAIYNEYEFEIRRVEFNRTSVIKTAILEFIIPGGFSGVIPRKLPWDS